MYIKYNHRKLMMCLTINFRIAIVIHTYNNYCKGVKDLIGKIKLQNNLLSHRGYQVLNISYQHFSFQDKLHKRTEFLIQRIRSLK